MNRISQEQILSHLQAHQQSMVEMLESLVNMDSPSTDKQRMDKICAVIEDLWSNVGAKTTVIPQEVSGNHLRAELGQGRDQVLLLCHMDTVWSAGETAKRPFKIVGDTAYGPGAYDMKAGIVQALFVMESLREMGLVTPARVVVLHNSDEEIGSPSSRAMIEEEARKSKAVLVLEPSADGGALKTWRKGVGMFEALFAGRAAHSGVNYEMGVSAIQEAARQVLHLHDLTNLGEGTTVNVGTFVGGTRSNVVAEQATLSIDLRVKAADVADVIIPKILGLHANDPRVNIQVTGGLNRPPMERNEKNMALFRLAREVGKEMGLHLEEAGTGGGSDGNFTSALGIPTLDGLGTVGGGAHAQDEHLLVSSLPERAALLAGLLLRL